MNDNKQPTHITEQNVEEQIKKAGYPDINRVNTRTVVIGSLIVVLIILLLSVLLPPSTSKTEPATKIESTTKSEPATESTTEATTSEEPILFDMGNIETSIPMEVFSIPDFHVAKDGFQTICNKLYYFEKGAKRFTGWLSIGCVNYYIEADGTVAIGWKEIDGVTYYFNKDGMMLTNQWVDERYLGTAGNMYVNKVTPDGIYVGNDGKEDTSLGKAGSTEGLTQLKASLEEMLSGYSGTWCVYVKDIQNKEYLSINNTQLFSASLIKLYCGAAAYNLIEQGTLEENDRIRSLMVQMISISDNDAFSLMVSACSGCNSQVAGRPVIQKYIDAEGYKDTTLTSMLLPTKYKAPSSPGRNYTSVEDCGLLLEKIYKGKCVNPEVSRKMMQLLLNQSHTQKIPAGVPDWITCANKTGDTDEFQHDTAIVFSPGGDYILCIMSENCGAAIMNSQAISKTVYEYFN
ncbi:MAG: hypothetical protein E7264_03830 [Lachnospiraceae bacterium]|nr:hypothetical protein [Lachnospiraceae bacterium]